MYNRHSNKYTFISIVKSDIGDHPIVYFNRELCTYGYPLNSRSRVNRLSAAILNSGNLRLLDPIFGEHGLRVTWINDDIQ